MIRSPRGDKGGRGFLGFGGAEREGSRPRGGGPTAARSPRRGAGPVRSLLDGRRRARRPGTGVAAGLRGPPPARDARAAAGSPPPGDAARWPPEWTAVVARGRARFPPAIPPGGLRSQRCGLKPSLCPSGVRFGVSSRPHPKLPELSPWCAPAPLAFIVSEEDPVVQPRCLLPPQPTRCRGRPLGGGTRWGRRGEWTPGSRLAGRWHEV